MGHLTNGAYRLHPIEWNIGESAGTLAAWCIANGCTPRKTYEDKALLAAFQEKLTADGIALHWYLDVGVDHPAFRAVQWLAGTGASVGPETDLFFLPDEEITEEEWLNWQQACGADERPAPLSTRADAAISLWIERASVPM